MLGKTEILILNNSYERTEIKNTLVFKQHLFLKSGKKTLKSSTNFLLNLHHPLNLQQNRIRVNNNKGEKAKRL